jgi:hypothetical protein
MIIVALNFTLSLSKGSQRWHSLKCTILLKTLAGILCTVVEKKKGNYLASFGATINLLLRRTTFIVR